MIRNPTKNLTEDVKLLRFAFQQGFMAGYQGATTRVLAVATDVAKKIPIEKGAQRIAFFFSGLLRTGS